MPGREQRKRNHPEDFQGSFGNQPPQLLYDSGHEKCHKTGNSEKRYVPEEFVSVVDEKDYREKGDENISDEEKPTHFARNSECRGKQNEDNNPSGPAQSQPVD